MTTPSVEGIRSKRMKQRISGTDFMGHISPKYTPFQLSLSLHTNYDCHFELNIK